MSDFATAGGHWYLPSGDPFYTIARADGKGNRPVTLRDARKNGAVPSVTGIIRMAAAPQLEIWKRKQLALALLTLPRVADESADDFLARAEQDWQEEGRDAADKGTAIHGAIERHYAGLPSDDWWDWVKIVRDVLQRDCGPQAWLPERSFAHPSGYGGKTDLHSDAWVIDVKGKEGDVAQEAPAVYDEHLMQLAAYRRGLRVPAARCGILFVGRDVPSAVMVEASADDLDRGLVMFDSLLAYWQAKNKYKP